MNSIEIFQLALNLQAPWHVKDIKFKEVETTGNKELHIEIGFKAGFDFGPGLKVHDTVAKDWRHLNFFEHTCYLHCRVPRLKDTEKGTVQMVEVPWARKGSGFTLLFEALSMALIEKEMPVNKVSELLGVYPQRIWTIFNYWISIAYNSDDQSGIRQLGLDETSVRKGHDYVTVAADIEERRVVHVTPGKDAAAIGRIKEHLSSKGCEADQIKTSCIDMSTGYISGMQEHFPDTAIVFDRFHVVKLLNEAMDKIRKLELKEHEILKGHKYLFLKNNKNLSASQKQERETLIELLPTIGEAYRLKLLFNDFWAFKDKEEAAGFLAYWCDLVEESSIIPMKKFVATVKSHWSGLINFIETKIANGIIEGINNKIQLAKRRARGYRNITNFINMIYFIAGKLKFNYPLIFT
jgi:transposase